MRRLLLATLVAAAVAPSSAAAPAPFTVGTGKYPRIAVDGAGTAYAAWNVRTGGVATSVMFCKVPRGATACASTQTLTSQLESNDPPAVFLPAPGVVLVLTHVCCNDHTYLFRSNDGGGSFGPPVEVGTIGPSGDAALAPDGSIMAVTDTNTFGTFFQRLPTDGSAAVTTQANPLPANEYGGTIGFAGGRPVIAAWDFNSSAPNGHIEFTTSPAGDPNVTASWTPPVTVGTGADTRMATATTGLFLLSHDGDPGQERLVVRAFSGSGFGAPVTIATGGSPRDEALFADAGGHVGATWERSSNLDFAQTTPGGAFQAPIVVTSDSGVGIFDQTGATAPDGQGFAIWDQNSSSGQVRMVPLVYAQKSTTSETTVGTDILTLATTPGCVQANGGKIVATLSTRSKKRKGHVVVKVGTADFGVDKAVRKVDRRSPFKVTLVITGLASGTKHTIFVKAHLRSHHGPKRTRTLKNTFTIC